MDNVYCLVLLKSITIRHRSGLLPVTSIVVTNLSVTHLQTRIATELQLEVDEVVKLVLVDTLEVCTIGSLSLEEVYLET